MTTDDVMVWVSQLIDQDVNVFDGRPGNQLSVFRLRPSRRGRPTMYRAIVAAPADLRDPGHDLRRSHAGGDPILRSERREHAGVLTGAARRQQEVSARSTIRSRRPSGALFFILLGAGIGLSMADGRGSDPPAARATGGLRAATSTRGLPFDHRRTNRAARGRRWYGRRAQGLARSARRAPAGSMAEMARQVAHEIKNHSRPFSFGRTSPAGLIGRADGPGIRGCVNRFGRSATAADRREFSSFASSPTARRSPADTRRSPTT